jgi:hypothetical protein
MSGRFFDRLSHLIVTVEIENICDQVQGILIVLYFCIEASEIEAIS